MTLHFTLIGPAPDLDSATVAIIGPPGGDGADGNTVLNGSGAPAGGTGANGDFYINTATYEIYGPKTAGAWGSPTALEGADGNDGADGAVWRDGTGAPANGLGANGDYYLDDATGDVYAKSGGSYSIVANIKGAAGSGTGDVVGPASSTDNAIARYDLATGKLLQNSTIGLSDTGTLAALSGSLTLTSPLIGTDTRPTANDAASLGVSGTAFSDLYLASGAVIDFAAGNAVITHSSGILTVSTGDLRVTTAGTNSASVVTVGGTQTLTNKTLTTPVLSGTASGTTAGRLGYSAGVLSFGDGTNQRSVATLEGGQTFTADISVPAEVYGAGWNGSNEVPTKNDIYDKIETLGGASGWTQISSQSASGASISFTSIPSTYEDLLLALEGVSHNDAGTASFNYKISKSNGATYSGLTPISGTDAATATWYGAMFIPGYKKNAGVIMAAARNLTSDETAGNASSPVTVTAWRASGGINAIQVLPSASSFDAGTLVLYGK